MLLLRTLNSDANFSYLDLESGVIPHIARQSIFRISYSTDMLHRISLRVVSCADYMMVYYLENLTQPNNRVRHPLENKAIKPWRNPLFGILETTLLPETKVYSIAYEDFSQQIKGNLFNLETYGISSADQKRFMDSTREAMHL